jgi:hypothetical protein
MKECTSMYKCWDPICRLTPHVGDLCIEILAYNCSGDERDLSECQETDGMCNPSSDIVGVVCENTQKCQESYHIKDPVIELKGGQDRCH